MQLNDVSISRAQICIRRFPLMLTRDSFPGLLKQRTVLLTGAGGGIGIEAALAFAAMGARVILAEIDPISGKRAEETVNAAYPASAVFYEVDLSSDEQLRRIDRKSVV